MSSDRHTVLVVDDSPFLRRIVCDVIGATDDFVVVGEAGDGEEAIRQVHALLPDLVTLDVQMPRLDGLQTLAHLMTHLPRPVVMLSALDDGGETTMRALELGAVDFVSKPSRGDVLDLPTLRERLPRALRTARDARYRSVAGLAPALRPPRHLAGRAPDDHSPPDRAATCVVAIAASTGGPRALAEIIPALPSSLDAAVIIAQHMPAGFTASLAQRLGQLAALHVTEARDGEPLRNGRVYVAPGGMHTTVRLDAGTPHLVVRAGPPVHGVSPAADPLFATVADSHGVGAVGVVLTGMGADGANGLRAIRRGGGRAIVQDEATSIVFGMPHAALALAGADVVAGIAGIAPAIVEAVGAAHRHRRTGGAAVAAATPGGTT